MIWPQNQQRTNRCGEAQLESLSLRQRFLAGHPLIGVLLRSPNEELVEIIAANGVDFIFLDCEHGPSDEAIIRQHIAAAALFDVETVVRVGELDRSLILRALDAGASGIVVPHLESADQTREYVQLTKYPPVGSRGFAMYSRAAGYGIRDTTRLTPADYKQWANENTLFIGMIESPAAATATSSILTPVGCGEYVDGYLVGTSDLGATTNQGDLSIEESLALIHDQARRVGKVRCDIVNSSEQGRKAREEGAQVTIYNLTALLGDAVRALV